ncbi:MAG: peptide-methionine (S)-S-oxide reductase MsrA, partial [Treponema sp.]|nr:peptide-methionine (S)-S-oxide reductase MsrA [Treponema sp.]
MKYIAIILMVASALAGCRRAEGSGRSDYMGANRASSFSGSASGVSGEIRGEVKTIYLAGGCFWGTEKYFALIPGVQATAVGYANGRTTNPRYEDVVYRNSGHAETVRIDYDPKLIGLSFLLDMYYKVIDPVSVNRQGNDVGTQYRTGVYFEDRADEAVIRASLAGLQKNYRQPLAVEVKPLDHFFLAEEYHQRYLEKNPAGYCHIEAGHFAEASRAVDRETRRYGDREAFMAKLTAMQFEVTQRNATEPPFANEYFATYEPGIYVDITTGEPLFVSTDKFKSDSGWPSFSRPIASGLVAELQDFDPPHAVGKVHLGHVFNDGPRESGGLRYCINSA